MRVSYKFARALSQCTTRALLIGAMGAGLLASQLAMAGVIDTVVDGSPSGPTLDSTVSPGEYAGTVSGGGAGFGGPFGGSTMSVDSDADGIYLAWDGMGDIGGNSIRVYFDVKPGGFSDLSSAGGFNDNADFSRERISRIARDGITLPFDADYGLILGEFFGEKREIFELATGGANSLIPAGSAVNNDIGFGPTASTVEVFIDHSILGTSPGDTIDFVAFYANNDDFGNSFLSDESFPQQFSAGNPGHGPVDATDFHRLVTAVPEPSTIALCLVGLSALALRRKG